MKKYTLLKRGNARKTRRKTIFICVALVVLAGAVAAGIYILNKKDTPAKTNTHTTSQKGETASSGNSSGSPTTTPNNPATNSENGKDSSPSSVSPTTPPATPSGTFISNHHPNLSGSPAPNKIQSTCITTPGAKCTIVFTKGTVSKSLDSQVADADGAVYWEWILQDKGLTEGVWKVTAVATLNNQTASTDDPINLEVKQ